MEGRISEALECAFRYGQIDGDHHKAWVIDQMVRALTGSDDAYSEFIERYKRNETDPEDEYEWDSGIAP